MQPWGACQYDKELVTQSSPLRHTTEQETKWKGLLCFSHIHVQTRLCPSNHTERPRCPWGHRTNHGSSLKCPIGLDPSHVPLILRPKQRSCSFHDWHPKEERGRTLESQWEPSLEISLQRLSFPWDLPQISAWSTAPTPDIRPKRGLPFLSSQRHSHLRMIKGAMLLLFPSTNSHKMVWSWLFSQDSD